MKKHSLISFVLSVSLLLSSMTAAVRAEDIPETTADTASETLPAVTQPLNPQTDLAFGSACVLNGCRTIDGNVPLAGSDRKLESAQSAFAFDRKTGTVIYSYNPDMKISPGGLAKIVTALIVIERCAEDEVVTVSSRNISRLPPGSQNQKLKDSEQLTVKDLLHCLIMAAANDAAVALAEYVAGNQESFITLMNQRVKQIGCTATEFGNVHGLDNASQFTTARDMARIVLEATKNETFRNLFKETEYIVPATNRSEERKFQSQDYLVDAKNVQKFFDTRVTGGMQSSTNVGGASIVYTSSYHNMDLVCVVMGCTRQMYENGWQVKVYGNFEEALDLLNFVYNNYKSNRVLYNGQALKQYAINGGECDVVVAPRMDIDSILPNDVQMDNLIMYYKDTGLDAPIEKDSMVATVQVWYRSSCLMEAELYAMNEVRPTATSGVSVLGGANRNSSESKFARYVIIGSAVILIPMIGYLAINAYLRARRREMMKRNARRRRRYNA